MTIELILEVLIPTSKIMHSTLRWIYCEVNRKLKLQIPLLLMKGVLVTYSCG